MASLFARKFYNTKPWRLCRKAYILNVNGLCERCLAKGKYKPGKILHHKKYLTPENINDPNVTLNWSNLEYVCQDCHNFEHHGQYLPVREDVMFDDEGNLVAKE